MASLKQLVLFALIALMSVGIVHPSTMDMVTLDEVTEDEVVTEIITEIITELEDATTALLGLTTSGSVSTKAASSASVSSNAASTQNSASVTATTAQATTAAPGSVTTTSATTVNALTTVSGTVSPSDIAVVGLNFTDDTVPFDLDVDNIITFEVDVQNTGGTDIASDDDNDNWSITFVVSDNADPTDSSAAAVISTNAETSTSTNMKAGITAGSTITLGSVLGLINVPAEDCSTYQYVCVVISKPSTAVYTDSDSTNNYYCLSAFGNSNAEDLQCSGCVARVSILLLLLVTVFAHLLS